MKRDARPNFTGKLVSLSLVGQEDVSVVESPRFEMQAGKWFLVGTVPPDGSIDDWCEGVVCAVAWDQVSNYLVFDSVEDYARRIGGTRKHKWKS